MTTITAPAPTAPSVPQGGSPHSVIGLMGVFTLMWTSNAAGSGVGPLTVLGGLGLAVGAALVLVWALTWPAARRAGRGDAAPASTTSRPTARRVHGRFAFAVAAEVVGIYAVNLALIRSGRPEFILPGIALVVALHFLLVHRAYPHPLHFVMTAAGVVVALGGIAAIALGVGPALVHGLVGLGMGAVTTTYGVVFVRVARDAARRGN